MSTIIVKVAGHKVTDTLIDRGLGVNIITNSLQIQLGLQGMQPSPFQVNMGDQRHVQPVGILKNLLFKYPACKSSLLQQYFKWKDLTMNTPCY